MCQVHKGKQTKEEVEFGLSRLVIHYLVTVLYLTTAMHLYSTTCYDIVVSYWSIIERSQLFLSLVSHVDLRVV